MNLSNILLRRKLAVTAFVGFAIFLALIFFILMESPGASTPHTANTPVQPSQEIAPGLPMRLKIPSIKVDAALDYVGLTPDGDLAVPKSPDSAGWYNLGPRPGEIGSAVIDGHFGLRDDVPAVFDNLNKLRTGDKIYVEDEKGQTISFVVSELKKYGPEEIVANVFHSNDGKAHLNLITCEGTWNAARKSYSDRLVVFADKE